MLCSNTRRRPSDVATIDIIATGDAAATPSRRTDHQDSATARTMGRSREKTTTAVPLWPSSHITAPPIVELLPEPTVLARRTLDPPRTTSGARSTIAAATPAPT